jgi:hypothetical protein
MCSQDGLNVLALGEWLDCHPGHERTMARWMRCMKYALRGAYIDDFRERFDLERGWLNVVVPPCKHSPNRFEAIRLQLYTEVINRPTYVQELSSAFCSPSTWSAGVDVTALSQMAAKFSVGGVLKFSSMSNMTMAIFFKVLRSVLTEGAGSTTKQFVVKFLSPAGRLLFEVMRQPSTEGRPPIFLLILHSSA